MSDLELKWDEKDIRNAIGLVGSMSDQVPYAGAIAINRTLEEASAALRPKIDKRFHIREQGLLERIAPRVLPKDQRASKTSLQGRIYSKDFAKLLVPFETGEEHRESTGADGRVNPVIIPTANLRPSPKVRIPRSIYPVNLGLFARKTINPQREGPYFYALGRGSLGGRAKKGVKKRATPISSTKSGRIQIKGRQGTFVLNELTAPALDPSKWGVYQRVNDKVVVQLWAFRKQVPRPRILDFESTVGPIAAARLRPNFEGAFEMAMRTARG